MIEPSLVPTHSGSTRALLRLASVTAVFCILWILSGVFYSPDPDLLAIKHYVNPNKARIAELLSLPGLGPTRAQAIVDYREQQQKQGQDQIFTSLDDLTKIKGLGPATIQRLAPYLNMSTNLDSSRDE